jgi:hypothetical protein
MRFCSEKSKNKKHKRTETENHRLNAFGGSTPRSGKAKPSV